MAKKKYTTEYYDIKKRQIDGYSDVTYHIAYGERNDGKSYSAKKVLIESIKCGYNFAYIRRLHAHIVRAKMIKVFDDVQDIAKKELGSEIYFDPQRGFYIKVNGEDKIVGYCTSLQDTMLVKSIPIVNIKYILFDEFMDYSYMPNEISMFLHAISTICRPPNVDVKIMMLGNTIAGECPYFKLFKIEPRKIKQGQVYYFNHSLGVSGTIEWTSTKVEDIRTKSKKDKYIGFDDNESVNMILFGEWEYQHCQTKRIDGITWNCMRHFVPIYLTASGQVYELTIHTDSTLPILFVRKPNIQMGMVKEKVKYNLSYDNTVILTTKSGIVPTIGKVNKLVDNRTLEKWELVCLCMESGRVIYDDISTGSEFMQFFKMVT